MAKNEKKTDGRHPDAKLIDRRATEVAAAMSRVLMQPGMTMQEALAAMGGGFCKVIQIIAPMLGEEPRSLADMFKGAIDNYFEHGGDPRIRDINNVMKQAGS